MKSSDRLHGHIIGNIRGRGYFQFRRYLPEVRHG